MCELVFYLYFPCFTWMFWLAANTLNEVCYGDDLPHSPRLSLMALYMYMGKMTLIVDLSRLSIGPTAHFQYSLDKSLTKESDIISMSGHWQSMFN